MADADMIANGNVQVQPTIEVVDPMVSDAPAQNPGTPRKDTVMADIPSVREASPIPARRARSRTPGRGSSRAASVHADPAPTIPSEAVPHGDPTRRYLNTKVTGVLLEGMKQLAKEKPNDPLRVLGEYLIQRSKEFEGTL